MPRPPPRPTLFPYTTLFRSCGSPPRKRRPRTDQHRAHRAEPGDAQLPAERRRGNAEHDILLVPSRADGSRGDQEYVVRSEEHTSELQSLAYLVCRLLLEKKK